MNKLELAEKAILAIEKAMPAIKVYNLGKTEKDLSVQRRSSGSFKFDTVLGGGWPK